jgi:hypothetical protein
LREIILFVLWWLWGYPQIWGVDMFLLVFGFGDRLSGKDNSKGEMRGSLHSAAHDEAVSGFGRDDDYWVGLRRTSNDKGEMQVLRPRCSQKARTTPLGPLRMTRFLGRRTATARAGGVSLYIPTLGAIKPRRRWGTQAVVAGGDSEQTTATTAAAWQLQLQLQLRQALVGVGLVA